MPKARTPKKLPDQAEIDYRKTRSDERWERRVEYLMEFFSQADVPSAPPSVQQRAEQLEQAQSQQHCRGG